MFNEKTKLIAKEIVKKVSPDELPQFEDMWVEIQEYENIPIDEADIMELKHGFGGGRSELFFITPVIISVVTRIAGKTLSPAYNIILAYFNDLIETGKFASVEEDQLHKIVKVINEEAQKLNQKI